MGRKDPVLEELFEVVRRDLEEVVNGEVDKVRSMLKCTDAKVYDSGYLLEISVQGGLVAGLPSQKTFYVRKIDTYEVLVEVEVLRDTVRYVLAKIRLLHLKDQEQTCYMDAEISYYGIEDLAKHIVLDFKVWSEVGNNE